MYNEDESQRTPRGDRPHSFNGTYPLDFDNSPRRKIGQESVFLGAIGAQYQGQVHNYSPGDYAPRTSVTLPSSGYTGPAHIMMQEFVPRTSAALPTYKNYAQSMPHAQTEPFVDYQRKVDGVAPEQQRGIVYGGPRDTAEARTQNMEDRYANQRVQPRGQRGVTYRGYEREGDMRIVYEDGHRSVPFPSGTPVTVMHSVEGGNLDTKGLTFSGYEREGMRQPYEATPGIHRHYSSPVVYTSTSHVRRMQVRSMRLHIRTCTHTHTA